MEKREVPQANDLTKVLRVPSLIYEGKNTAALVAKELGFTLRQAHYYFLAAENLGLIEKHSKSEFKLSLKGHAFVEADAKGKKDIALNAIESMSIISLCFSMTTPKKICKEDVAKIIRDQARLAESTSRRRADTIMNWLNWLSYHCPSVYEFKNNCFVKKA